MSRSFYTAVTQQVLLFEAESWVLTKRMESDMDAFQDRVARRLTGQLPRQGRDGKWVYPSLAGALKEAGVVRARTSVLRRQNTAVQFIATRPILGLCEVAERRRGTFVPQRWWEHPPEVFELHHRRDIFPMGVARLFLCDPQLGLS